MKLDVKPLAMLRAPDPRAVGLSVSGFVVGVLVTLLVTGVVTHTSTSPRVVATLPAPKPVRPSALQQKVRVLAEGALGPSLADQKASRLLALKLSPVALLPPSIDRGEGPDPRFRSLYLRFRLNDHPLGGVWRLKEAKADVFRLLKSIYTSALPIYNVTLVGRFPLPVGRTAADTDAVVVYISYSTASRIPWKRWGREHEQQLWDELNYKFVKRGFG